MYTDSITGRYFRIFIGLVGTNEITGEVIILDMYDV